MEVTKKKFALNTSWIIVGKVFQIGITFLTTMLVARYLGPEKYGTINHTYSYVVIFSSFATLGLNDIVVKELLDPKNNKEEILGTMIVLKAISSIVSIGATYLAIVITNNSEIARLVTLLQAFSLLFQVFDSINYFYQAKLLTMKTAIINIIAYSLTTLFRIYGLLTKKNIEWFAFAVSLDFLVVSVLLICLYLKEGYRLSFSKKIVKELLKKGYTYIFVGLMIAVYTKADTLLLGEMVDDTAVGYYTAATTICNAWPFLLQAIIDSANPIIMDLFNNDRKAYLKRLKQLYSSIFYISIAVGIVIILLGKVIIGIIYGIDYLPAVTPIRIVCLSTAFSYFGVIRRTWMQCEGKIKYERRLYLLGAISNIILNYVLIKNFGIAGAAIALTLTQFLTNFVYVWLLKETRENGRIMLDAIMLKGVFK